MMIAIHLLNKNKVKISILMIKNTFNKIKNKINLNKI